MSWQNRWEHWKSDAEEAGLRAEARAMDAPTAEGCFNKDLDFGTGGLRGVLGAGTNRMNIYTVRKATKGFADYIREAGPDAMSAGVAIAFDNRRMSRRFAREAAGVLALNGVHAYLYHSLRPTPMLSFAVRRLGCFGGIMITASHNPPQYNGYKLYDGNGCQLVPALSEAVKARIDAVGDELAVGCAMDEVSQNRIHMIGREVDDAYFKELMGIQLNPGLDKKGLKIVFSPQHGTANVPVCRTLAALHYDFNIVKKQAYPSPDFVNTKSPNPEKNEAYGLAIETARACGADIVITTDPDADRLGVVEMHGGNPVYLTGNQTGAILLEYILSQRKKQNTLPGNGIVINTIVTCELGDMVAKAYGMQVEKTLTGFKFIGDRIHAYELNRERTFVFGFEESYGYLIQSFARDKDAMQAVLMVCEAAVFYKNGGRTLADVLDGLYRQYGYFAEGQYSIELDGKAGSERIAQIMGSLRKEPPVELAGLGVSALVDYDALKRLPGWKAPNNALPEADVLKFQLADESWAVARPSGTEPKLKFYFCARGKSAEEARARLSGMTEYFKKFG